MRDRIKARIAWQLPLVLLCAMAIRAAALNVAVPYIEAEFMWDRGYSGSGVEIGIIDLFLADDRHPAIDGNFLGSQQFVNGAAWIGPHATQVAGAAVSEDPLYTGVAPEAGWWTAQTTNRGTISSQRKQTIAAESLAQGLGGLNGNPVEVITMSIALSGSSDGNDQWTRALDHIVNSNSRLVTVAAGNSGPDDSSLAGLPIGAFNTLTVGATGDTGGNPSEDYDRVATFSSRGPTPDGRSNVDIVAPGSLLYLPIPNSGWSSSSGTSVATPLVAGAAALLIDMGWHLGYTTDPRVIKSALLNSATKLEGWTHTQLQPLDLAMGAGQINLKNAYEQYHPGEHPPGNVPLTGWDLGLLPEQSEKLYEVDTEVLAGSTITATLAWNRIVTTDSEDIEQVTYSSIPLSNLDLFVYDADNLSFPLARSISTVDNVEHIHYSVPDSGRYVVGVKAPGSLTHSTETYALAWNIIAPTEIPGDINGDNLADSIDIDLLRGAILDMSSDVKFDVNGSGGSVPDEADFNYLIEDIIGTQRGDGDLNRVINFRDFVALSNNIGQSNTTWDQGNYNLDRLTNFADFVELSTRFGMVLSPSKLTPEPRALLLMLIGTTTLQRRQR